MNDETDPRQADLADSLVQLAARHDLALQPDSLRVNEAGLDYQVALAQDAAGDGWVLRVPRRDDVSAKIHDERRILEFLAPRLSVEIPDWRVAAADLVAYPLLPGEPGLTIDDDGSPVMHFDPGAPEYLRSFGRLLAELHAVDADEARIAGLVIETPDDVRTAWRARLDAAVAEFDVPAPAREQWSRWIGDDSMWADAMRFCHGELYPAHLLLADDGRVLSVLDWTTAKVTDPIADFALQQAMSPPEDFEIVLDAYRGAGGVVPDRLAERGAALIGASALGYAEFALLTGEDEHRAATQALLDAAAGG
ncbi:macrolide 2'-phosphotransferase [Zhihengliuella salsuginis]|uniref:Aminoglycoside phosphotransferase n=1 Tax=Zhihengliuella salsuginis TaxID=578222 RepID=A0ABQ3GJH5_9MICC|nr:macrolide 2'-phosphotransferase [Zhihengliuella salsuginis]GHD09360.1 aminoglycoside phosphotransferase [Zhihengliuella salsuginis]